MSVLVELGSLVESYEWAAKEAAKRGEFHRAAREQDHAAGVRIAMDLIANRASESCQTCIEAAEQLAHSAHLGIEEGDDQKG